VEGLNKAVDYFQRAMRSIQIMLWLRGLADCYSLLGSFLGASPRENLSKAKENAVKALTLDDSLSEAHASLAKIA